MRTLVAVLLLALCSLVKAATPSALLTQASAFQGYADKDLQVAKTYSLLVSVGLAGMPIGSIMSSAYSAGFAGLSDRDLQVLQAYATAQGLVSIYVSPNTNSSTFGVQEALNAIPTTAASYGTNVIGADISLSAGDYYITNGAGYRSSYKYFIRIHGAGPGTRLIYTSNNNTRSNCLFFGGGLVANPNGGLDLPAHVILEGLTFMSLTNDLLSLVRVTNNSAIWIKNCNITGYEITTNQTHGAQLSIDGPAPSQPPGNVGLTLGSLYDHGTFIEDCFFANLATGVDSWTDHLYINNFKCAFIGEYGPVPTGGTAWANTSFHSLGAAVLLHGGLSVNIVNPHLYIVDTGFAFDAGVETTIIHPQWELTDHPLAAFNSSTAVYVIESATSLASDSTWDISHGPYALTASSTFRPIWPAWSKYMINVDGNNFTVTNMARVSTRTNLCPQPAAGFTPNFNLQNETANTNNGGPIVFAAGTLPVVYGSDMIYHEVLIHKSVAGDQPVIFPAPYVTNINLTSLGGTYRCTNNSLVQIRLWPGALTNVWCFPIN